MLYGTGITKLRSFTVSRSTCTGVQTYTVRELYLGGKTRSGIVGPFEEGKRGKNNSKGTEETGNSVFVLENLGTRALGNILP